MFRYKMSIEYFGADYHGWQKQNKLYTIQSVIENALEITLKENIVLMGSGRTDAGVHAKEQIAHFDTKNPLQVEKLLASVNALTPTSILIHSIEKSDSHFHARYDAIQRKYLYKISFKPKVLEAQTFWYVPFSLDFKLFQTELMCVLGEQNFKGFSVDRKNGKSTVCTVTQAKVEQEEDSWKIYISANRFLHKMVRSIVGACYDVARGKHQPGLISKVFLGKEKQNFVWAPPCGLVLQKVIYSAEEKEK